MPGPLEQLVDDINYLVSDLIEEAIFLARRDETGGNVRFASPQPLAPLEQMN